MLKILTLPLNFHKVWGFLLQTLHFWTKAFGQEVFFCEISDSPKFGGGNCPLTPIQAVMSCHRNVVKMCKNALRSLVSWDFVQ